MPIFAMKTIIQLMDKSQLSIIGIFSVVWSFFDPIAGNIFALSVAFLLNFVFGYFAALVNNEPFDWKKALRCVEEAAVFFVLAAGVYTCGTFNGNESGAIQCVSSFALAIMIIYGINITRNGKAIFKKGTPAWTIFAFLYYVLSVEWIKKVPFLSDFLNSELNKQEEEK